MIFHLLCACKYLILKEITVPQVPEEPKKVVPEKKYPVIKKPEPPPPKGTYVKIHVYVISIPFKMQFVVYYAVLCLFAVIYVTVLYRLAESNVTILYF